MNLELADGLSRRASDTGWQVPQYKLEGDLLHLRGSLEGAALEKVGGGLVVAPLPREVRPWRHGAFSTRGGGTAKARTDVRLDVGIVAVAFTEAGRVLFLDGITISIAQDGWTELPLQPGWAMRAGRDVW